MKHIPHIIKNSLRVMKNSTLLALYYPHTSFRLKTKTYDDGYHLKLAIEWIKTAQKATGGKGVSAYYKLLEQTWGAPYRETTGYIIPTLLRYAAITGDMDSKAKAIEMGDWEIENQTREGAIAEQEDGTGIKIFNTGQVLLGWCTLYDTTRDKKYLDAAVRSSDWLVSNQDVDGSWKNFSNNGGNGIDTRVSWALLEVHKRTNNNHYKESAQKQITWTLKQQNEEGWFSNSSLKDPNRPWTHAIAYTIMGILECAFILNDKKMMERAIQPAEKLLEYYNSKGKAFFPGTFDKKWESSDSYSCLTGDAQIASIWLRLHTITGSKRFIESALKIIESLKRIHIVSKNPNLHGGIPGSYPVAGGYATYSLPNWAVKFFADAIMLKNNEGLDLLA